MKPIAYQARDGLTLHGYLTTPVGVPATGLPLVLLVHGGPWVRDMWGYDPEVQWLANRGYAVLQVNYRGSTGYGRKFYMAGFREWGGKMQNDLTDGVQWAIKQGIADPKRVAIMGASYGGFAVLAGVAFTPDLYVAGVDLCGPPNLCAYAERVAGGTTGYGDEVEAAVGHPVKDHKRLLAHSPLTAAEKIKAPLLIGQGVHDPRITVEESEQMVNTLRQLGKPVEYLRYPDEGHGLARLENRLDFYGHAEQFLTKYLGGRCEPSAK
jgi:dipeptidyl aminopeptidase/acylaminoacyl peptidase